MRPFLPLAERSGRICSSRSTRGAARLEIEYQGQLADYDTRILTLSRAEGCVRRRQRRAGVVRQRAAIAPSAVSRCASPRSSTAQDYVNLVTVRGGGHAVAGTLVGLRGEPRIVMIDDLSVDLPPASTC